MTTLNGNDVEEMIAYRDGIRDDPRKAERRPSLTAEWTGGDRSHVTIAGKTLEVNEPGRLGPMQLVLAAIASCEVDVIASACTLMGVPIEKLTVEARGEFDVRTYLGIEGGPPSGYDSIAIVARLRAPSLTEAQIARLRRAIEHESPVGDTLARQVRCTGTIELV